MSEEIVTADDGMDANVVGPWAEEKHVRVRKYVGISSGARSKFTKNSRHPYPACFIDLYCATGRAMIRGTDRFIDGSSIAAWRESCAKKSPFSNIVIGDANLDRLETCKSRLEALGAKVTALHGPASETAKEAARIVERSGYHVALLDPYNLSAMPFSVISDLAALKNIDMIVRFDSGDLERNLGNNIVGNQNSLDAFCPGWRQAINPGRNQAQKQEVFELWLERIRALSMIPSHRIPDVKNNNNRSIYWLVFLSRHELADKFWGDVSNIDNQGDLF